MPAGSGLNELGVFAELNRKSNQEPIRERRGESVGFLSLGTGRRRDGFQSIPNGGNWENSVPPFPVRETKGQDPTHVVPRVSRETKGWSRVLKTASGVSGFPESPK